MAIKNQSSGRSIAGANADHDSSDSEEPDAHTHSHEHNQDHNHDHDHGPNHEHEHAHNHDPSHQGIGREAMMEIQMIQQQLEEIGKMLTNIDEQISESTQMATALDELENLPASSSVLVPIVRGMFASATLPKPEAVKVNVGAGVMVEKSIPDAKELIDKQVSELSEAKEQLQGQQAAFVARARQLGARVTQA
jgi:prefoldin alpha subunit